MPPKCQDCHPRPLHLLECSFPSFFAWHILLILHNSGQKQPLLPKPLHTVRWRFLLEHPVFLFSPWFPPSIKCLENQPSIMFWLWILTTNHKCLVHLADD